MRNRTFKAKTFLSTFSIGLSLLVLITGCSSNGTSSNSIELKPTTSETSTPKKINQTETSPAPILDEVINLGLTCSDLISVQNLYDLNPNLAEISAPNPESGTLQAEAISRGGINCLYQNLSSNQQIVVSVVKLPESVLTSFSKKLIEKSQTSDEVLGGSEGSGFFDRSKNIGIAQAMVGEFWIVVSSAEYFEAIDASEFVSIIAHKVKPS